MNMGAKKICMHHLKRNGVRWKLIRTMTTVLPSQDEDGFVLTLR
jgi:hypothetical protein